MENTSKSTAMSSPSAFVFRPFAARSSQSIPSILAVRALSARAISQQQRTGVPPPPSSSEPPARQPPLNSCTSSGPRLPLTPTTPLPPSSPATFTPLTKLHSAGNTTGTFSGDDRKQVDTTAHSSVTNTSRQEGDDGVGFTDGEKNELATKAQATSNSLVLRDAVLSRRDATPAFQSPSVHDLSSPLPEMDPSGVFQLIDTALAHRSRLVHVESLLTNEIAKRHSREEALVSQEAKNHQLLDKLNQIEMKMVEQQAHKLALEARLHDAQQAQVAQSLETSLQKIETIKNMTVSVQAELAKERDTAVAELKEMHQHNSACEASNAILLQQSSKRERLCDEQNIAIETLKDEAQLLTLANNHLQADLNKERDKLMELHAENELVKLDLASAVCQVQVHEKRLQKEETLKPATRDTGASTADDRSFDLFALHTLLRRQHEGTCLKLDASRGEASTYHDNCVRLMEEHRDLQNVISTIQHSMLARGAELDLQTKSHAEALAHLQRQYENSQSQLLEAKSQEKGILVPKLQALENEKTELQAWKQDQLAKDQAREREIQQLRDALQEAHIRVIAQYAVERMSALSTRIRVYRYRFKKSLVEYKYPSTLLGTSCVIELPEISPSTTSKESRQLVEDGVSGPLSETSSCAVQQQKNAPKRGRPKVLITEEGDHDDDFLNEPTSKTRPKKTSKQTHIATAVSRDTGGLVVEDEPPQVHTEQEDVEEENRLLTSTTRSTRQNKGRGKGIEPRAPSKRSLKRSGK
ncbi:hypothetical protein BG004_000781 [Podila humilis]|nr:hypothetical protein BG004_000781 [Podila humilis]